MGKTGTKQRLYSLELKMRVLRRLDELNGNGNQTALEFGLPRQRVYDWKRDREQILGQDSGGGMGQRTGRRRPGHRGKEEEKSPERCFICRETEPEMIPMDTPASASRRRLAEVVADVGEVEVRPGASVCRRCCRSLNTIDRMENSLATLKRSIRNKLDDQIRPRAINRPEERRMSSFVCEVCGKVYRSKSGVKAHLSIHRGEFRHTCAECGHGFVARAAYDAHRLIHTGEKPIVCELCGRRFRQAASLWTHNMLHHGKRQKTYQCETCGKFSTTSWHLLKHRKTHLKKERKIIKLEDATLENDIFTPGLEQDDEFIPMPFELSDVLGSGDLVPPMCLDTVPYPTGCL